MGKSTLFKLGKKDRNMRNEHKLCNNLQFALKT